MNFEIDVSGEDILSKNYTIVVADKNDLIKGFKFDEKLIKTLRSHHIEGRYRYITSRHGKSLLKVRLYCIIIYYLFRAIKTKEKKVNIEICRDFHGHEREITSQLKYFLETKLGFKINIRYLKLPKGCNADKYSSLMRRDTKNKIEGYEKISLEDIEKYLKKK